MNFDLYYSVWMFVQVVQMLFILYALTGKRYQPTLIFMSVGNGMLCLLLILQEAWALVFVWAILTVLPLFVWYKISLEDHSQGE